MKKLIFAFLYVQIFTNAFALSSVLTMALAISVLLFAIGVIKGHYVFNLSEPPFLFAFFLLLFFGYFFIATGEKKTNHLLMWTVPVVCYFFMFKRQVIKLFTLEEIKSSLLKVITLATLTACFFSVIEFVSVNFWGNSLDFIPRGTVDEYEPLAIDNIRARSFMEESGHYSMYWEIFTPLCVYWIRSEITKRAVRLMMYAIFLLGIAVCFSAFGYVCVLLWAVALILFQMKKAKSVRKTVSIIGVALIILALVIIIFPVIFDSIVLIISNKLDPGNVSHSDRETRFEAIRYLNGIYFLTGFGPNAADTLQLDYTFVSFYLGILMSTGILGLICFALFLMQQLKYIMGLRDPELRFSFFLSFWFSSMHLMFIDNIYVPWFWVMLSILGAVHFKEKELIRLERKKYENFI